MIRLSLMLIVLAAGLSVCPEVRAQSVLTSPPAGGTATVPAATTAYRLATEDRISVVVSNFPELACQAEVQPDGTITVPLLGSVAVTGQTTTESADQLARLWKKFVKNPFVVVSIVQKRPASVVVYGSAVRPGSIPYRPGIRLSEVMAAVGGIAPDGDADRIALLRRNGERLQLTWDRSGVSKTDPVLEEGDILRIAERHDEVSIVGEVSRPGSMPFREGMLLLTALTAAQVRETADLSNAVLRRGPKDIPVDLDALLRRGDTRGNIPLQPGDTLMVPEAKNRTYVFGAVSRPGYYLFKPGDRILDALNFIGPGQQANLGDIRLLRQDQKTSKVAVKKIDLNKFLQKGEIAQNMEIAPGDVLFIPDKRRPFSWQDFLSAAGGVGVLLNTAHTLGVAR